MTTELAASVATAGVKSELAASVATAGVKSELAASVATVGGRSKSGGAATVVTAGAADEEKELLKSCMVQATDVPASGTLLG